MSGILSAHPADPRLTPTGISDPRADLAISDEAQAWVRRDDLAAVTGEHMLAPAGQPGVRLHVTDQCLPAPVPLGRLLADLSVHSGPRERTACSTKTDREQLTSRRPNQHLGHAQPDSPAGYDRHARSQALGGQS